MLRATQAGVIQRRGSTIPLHNRRDYTRNNHGGACHRGYHNYDHDDSHPCSIHEHTYSNNHAVKLVHAYIGFAVTTLAAIHIALSARALARYLYITK